MNHTEWLKKAAGDLVEKATAHDPRTVVRPGQVIRKYLPRVLAPDDEIAEATSDRATEAAILADARGALYTDSLVEDAEVALGYFSPDGTRILTKAVPKTDYEKRRVRFSLSVQSKTPDRQGHTVAASGWDLRNYVRNGVGLWAHDNARLPISKNVAIGAVRNSLQQAVEFDDGEFASDCFRLVQKDFLRAWSPGFIPMEWKIREKPPGVDFLKQELLESSLCNVPANPEALTLMADVGYLNPERAHDDDVRAEMSEVLTKIHRKVREWATGDSPRYISDEDSETRAAVLAIAKEALLR